MIDNQIEKLALSNENKSSLQIEKLAHTLETKLGSQLEKQSQTLENNIMEKQIISKLESEKESQIMKNYCLIIMKLLNQDYKLTNKFKLLRYGSLIILRGLYVNLKTRF